MAVQWQRKLGRIMLACLVIACGVLTLFGPGLNAALTALGNEGSDGTGGQKPYIMYAMVSAYQGYMTPSNSGMTVDVAVADPDGSVPSTIASVTVSGPGGFYYAFVPSDYSGSGEYWHALDGLVPADGQYVFTVTDNQGLSATSYFYLTKGQAVPVPDTATFQASGSDILTPTLSWATLPGYAGNLYYRARIYTAAGNRVFSSPYSYNTTSVTVPSGVLTAGQTYKWRVDAIDGPNGAVNNNYSTATPIDLVLDNSSVFGTQVAVYKQHNDDGSIATVLTGQGGYQGGDVSRPVITGPGGFQYTFKYSDCALTPPYACTKALINKDPAAGQYKFKSTNQDGSVYETYFYLNPYEVPVVDDDTCHAYDNLLAPRLAWSVPAGVDRPLYYVAQILNAAGSTVVWSSSWTTKTTVTVPAGILQAGESYKWRVVANDSKQLYSANRSISAAKALSLETSVPRFDFAVVYNRHTPEGVFTALYTKVGDPAGSLPGSIATLIVSGPSGFSYSFQPSDYDPVSGEYYHGVPGSPAEGLYTFTVTTTAGPSVVTRWYHRVGGGTIPLLSEGGLQISGAALTPTISWSAVAGDPRHLYYRVQVFEEVAGSSNSIYTSPLAPTTYQTLPAGTLASGKVYTYRVEAMDSPDTPAYDNRVNSSRLPLYPLPPGKPTLISPSGTISTKTPTYTWNALGSATRYRMYVEDASGPKIDQWYTAAQAGCAAGTGTCSVTPGTLLALGAGRWQVMGENEGAAGAWSDLMDFTVEQIPPGQVTLISPSGDLDTTTPTYSWIADSKSTKYLLQVDDSLTPNKIQKWYTAAEAGCGTGTGNCSVTPTTALAAGPGQWRVQTYNAFGTGPWSGYLPFTAPTPPCPGIPTLIAPTGSSSTNLPTYSWYAAANAASYYLWVNDQTGAVVKNLYSAMDAGCAGGGTCSATPDVPIAKGNAQWWVQALNSSCTGDWSEGMVFTSPGPQVISKPTPIAPSGTIVTNNPTYTWQAVSTASWYRLWVNDGNANPAIDRWYMASEANCAAGTGTCSVTPDIPVGGAGKWWVKAWNRNGEGPWSDTMAFTAPTLPTPGKAQLIAPIGEIQTSWPTYSWNAVADATWYMLQVDDSNGAAIRTWYQASAVGCPAGTGVCSITPSTTVQGYSTWWIVTWNAAGKGGLSDPLNFTAPQPKAPGKATLLSPSGEIGGKMPAYFWNADPVATWYLLSVSDKTGNVIQKWCTAAQANCGSGSGTCSATPDTALATGDAKWWIQTWNPVGSTWSDAMSFTVP